MFHINIVGVVICSDNSTRKLVTCIIKFFSIHFIITLHSSIATTSASQYKKKAKIEQNASNTCLANSCPAIACLASWSGNFMSVIFSAPCGRCGCWTSVGSNTSVACAGTDWRRFNPLIELHTLNRTKMATSWRPLQKPSLIQGKLPVCIIFIS